MQEQHLELRHTQKLILTPALKLSLKVLQLPILELKEYLEQELEQNPLLEIKEETEEEDSFNMEDWSNYVGKDYRVIRREKEEDKPYESLLKNKYTLQEHLLWQLRLLEISSEDYRIGEYIIGNINDDGYLTMVPSEIAEKYYIPHEKINKVLTLIQGFEPVGVGAGNLRECLQIQLRAKNEKNGIAWKIVTEFWDDFQKGKFNDIASKLNLHIQEIYEVSKIISKLEPKPGREVNEDEVRYIIPDVTVEKRDDGKYLITINNQGIPMLQISKFYKQYLTRKDIKAEEKNFINEKFKLATWLIKSIEQRKKTLYEVTRVIVEKQKEFLEKGIEFFKPLSLREVSSEINVHESTVSRVTTNKYMQTPRGIFSFKYFFNVRLDSVQGEGVSTTLVKDILKNIVEGEEKNKPLSDSKIVNLLFEKGINASRRTIAKYRKELGILPASKRKVMSNIFK